MRLATTLAQARVKATRSTSKAKRTTLDGPRFQRAKLLKVDAATQVVLGVVLEPETTDAQGDIYAPDVVTAAQIHYMRDWQRRGLMHEVDAGAYAEIVESYVLPSSVTFRAQALPAGTWLMAMKILDPLVWQMVEAGQITGFSVGGWVTAQDLP